MTYPLVTTLPEGDAGVDQTLRAMAAMARHGAATVPAGWGRREVWWHLTPAMRARSLRGFLAARVRYVDDPPGAELVRHPLQMLEQIATTGEAEGDCDDVATLGAMLALVMGLRVRWVVLGFDRDAPFSHVFAEVAAPEGGQWVDLDVTRPEALPSLLVRPVRRQVVEL